MVFALKTPCPKCGERMLESPYGSFNLPEGHYEHSFQAYICDGCGYTEFYSNELGKNGPETIEVEEDSYRKLKTNG